MKCNEQVYATQVVSTVITSPKNPDTNIHIPGSIVLNDICGDFTVRFDVYCIQAQEEYLPHEVKYHINKKVSHQIFDSHDFNGSFFLIGRQQINT